MISSTNSDHSYDEAGRRYFHDYDFDSDDSISELYAQEIEENLINENLEAALSSKVSVAVNDVRQGNIEKSRENKTKNPIQPLVQKICNTSSGVIPKHAFSYINNSNLAVSYPIQPSLKEGNERFANSLEKTPTENSDPILKLKTNSSSHSKIQSDLSSQDKKVPGKLGAKAFAFLQTPTQINLQNIQKGNNHDNSRSNTENVETIESPPPLPARPPPIFKYPSLIFKTTTKSLEAQTSVKNELMITTASFVSDGSQVKILSGNGSKINFDNNESQHVMRPNLSIEASGRMITRPLKCSPFVEELNKQLKLQESASFINGTTCHSQAKIMSTEMPQLSDNQIKTKPEVPRKPDQMFNHRLQRLIDEKNQEIENQLSKRKISPKFGKRLPDIPNKNIKVIEERNTAKINGPSVKKSISCDIKNDDEIPFFKFPNSSIDKIEDQKTESPFKFGQYKVDENSQNVTDFDALQNAMNRPSLPQKLRATQRSKSCNSLVQTFKDISLALWNPPDKDKRISVGQLPSNMKDVKIGSAVSPTRNFNFGRTDGSNVEENRNFQCSGRRLSSESGKLISLHRDIERNLWYHDVTALEAQQRLLNLDQDGAFLVRPSSRPTDEIKYTVSVIHSGRVFNIHIRRKDNDRYVLGKGKEWAKSFSSISELIKYYQDIPFEVRTSGCNNSFGVYFRVTPPR